MNLTKKYRINIFFLLASLILGVMCGFFLAMPQLSEYSKEIENNELKISELEETLYESKLLIKNQSLQITYLFDVISKLNTRDSLWLVNNDIEVLEINPKTGDIAATYPINHTYQGEFHAGWSSGIAYDGEYIWLAAANSDEIIKMNSSDLSIVSIFDSPGPRPMGLAWDGEYLWCVDAGYNSNTNGVLYKMNPESLSVVLLHELSYNEPSGLTWDGNHLWVAEKGNDSRDPGLHKHDPVKGLKLKHYNLPVPKKFVGLAWEDNYLWVSFSSQEPGGLEEIGEIYKFYPRTNEFIKQFNVPADSNIYTGLTIAQSSYHILLKSE